MTSPQIRTYYNAIPGSCFHEQVAEGVVKTHVFYGGRLDVEVGSPLDKELMKIADKSGSPISLGGSPHVPDMDIAKQETVKNAMNAIDKITHAQVS